MPLSLEEFRPDSHRDVPIYRQLASEIAAQIRDGRLQPGDRLPATRELAGQLGLNRSTVAAAYEVLERNGQLSGHVGRGSFVSSGTPLDVTELATSKETVINFASSRPATDGFPLASFRKLSKAVIDSVEAPAILQLGSPQGYAPLRRFLLDRDRAAGLAEPDDDVLITNGCQQALDLIARAFITHQYQHDATAVLVEDPVYHGLIRIFNRAGARLLPVPVGSNGIDVERTEELMDRFRPALLVVTPEFQNPTGWTIPLENRRRLIAMARRHGVTLVENAIYSQLRYVGHPLPPLKQLDKAGPAILLRSYSKILFPGLRVGWVTAPHDIIRRLTEEKQIADLHSDQLAQAIFLRFAESGELDEHIRRTCEAGKQRLTAAFRACEQSWPEGTNWSRPEGGMSLWVDLPPTLSAELLRRRVNAEHVDFLPGTNFSAAGGHSASLRLSFGGLAPSQIERGIGILGAAAAAQLGASARSLQFEYATAVV